ncbi:MAG: hypothetical protein OXU48_01635 [candidate division Zixibacteria bacterium]|nr:hypothetical protein [candidate division Zixibacteria bacterium]
MASLIVLPLDTSRASHLARITFDEPGGAVSNDGQGDRPMAILGDSTTGQDRGFLQDLPVS